MDVFAHFYLPADKVSFPVIAGGGVGMEDDLLFPANKLWHNLVTSVRMRVGRHFFFPAEQHVRVAVLGVGMPLSLRQSADQVALLIVAASVQIANELRRCLIAVRDMRVITGFRLSTGQRPGYLITVGVMDMPGVNVRGLLFKSTGRFSRFAIAGCVVGMPFPLFHATGQNSGFLITGDAVGVGFNLL